jgi:hypothetical protein
MAYLSDVLESLADAIEAQLAPYQPNLLPDYPNAAPTAGQIPSTLVGPGHPLQYPVMERLENKQATVVIYGGKLEQTPGDYLPTIMTAPGVYTQFEEVARSKKEVVIEIWSYDYPSREAITNLIRSFTGDYVRLTENDGTTTIHTYIRTVPFDQEQNDSLYINQMFLWSDYTVTQASTSYTVKTTDLTLQIEDPNSDLLDTLHPVQ